MDQQTNIRGIRIRTVNMVMLTLSIILFLAVLYTTLQISGRYQATIEAIDNYIKWEKAAHDIHVGSEYLTEQARLFAETGNPRFIEKYFEELNDSRRRDHALDVFFLYSNSDDHKAALQKAFDLSNALTSKEIYAMRLAGEATAKDMGAPPWNLLKTSLAPADEGLSAAEKLTKARATLFSSAYSNSKEAITDALSDVLKQSLALTRQELTAQTRELGEVLIEQRIALITLCLLNILTFAMIIVLIVKPLKIYLNNIRDDKMLELTGAYEFKHLALTYNDIFALKEHHDRMLKHKAEHDPLTGLLNRNAFDALRSLLEQTGEPMGFAIVDVDKFKEINDTFGHEMGDRALCRVADLLQQNFRANDYCIRLGGDEFAVVLNGMPRSMGIIACEKINLINNELANPQNDLPPLSISVGVAFSSKNFTEDLYRNADAALYEVKSAGRRGCRFYKPGETRSVKR